MEILDRAATLFGTAPLLRMADGTLTFSDCNRIAGAIANRLVRMGINSGDVVAIASPNSPEMALLLLALLKAGIIAAPLNFRFPASLLNATVARLQPRLCITNVATSLLAESITIDELLDGISLNTAFHAASDALSNSDLPALHFAAKAEMMRQPVTIIHTSASSGEAKAAVHSFANHWYSALGSNENLPFGAGDCWLLSLPLYHIGGYSLLFRALLSGGALAIAEPHEPLDQSLRTFPLTHLSLVPTQLYRLLADRESTEHLQNLKAVLLGGSAAPKSLLDEAIRQRIPLYLSYGSTEMSSQIATTPSPIIARQAHSGKLLLYREMMVAADGELLVKGNCLFQGYLREGRVEPQTDDDGWFHTSDIGSIADDGSLTVVGRKDNMFIAGGENIHPEEIETALLLLDGIVEALVVPVDDAEYGARPVAFLKTDEAGTPDDAALDLKMKSLVGTLKSPTCYYRVEKWATLPGLQKIDRRFYKKLAREGVFLGSAITLLPPDA